ncbi:MAG: hypothetical protein RBS57_09630 [Desulforhabdus sp.]|jgi:hypothetical protein|nr:hypothetical protein [Desulforhabdus sp.]
MKAKRLFYLLAICLIASAIVGCGETASTGTEKKQSEANPVKESQASLLDPCEIITKIEAEAALGEPLKQERPSTAANPLNQRQCFYSSDSSDRFILVSILQTPGLTPAVREQGQSAATIFKTIKENLDPVATVQGIGDDACWGTPGLHILAGETYLLIGVGNTSRPENLEFAKSLASTALGRL